MKASDVEIEAAAEWDQVRIPLPHCTEVSAHRAQPKSSGPSAGFGQVILKLKGYFQKENEKE